MDNEGGKGVQQVIQELAGRKTQAGENRRLNITDNLRQVTLDSARDKTEGMLGAPDPLHILLEP